MSYQALYRKYRPADLDTVVGQESIKTALSNAVKNQKLTHAYLFSGYRGTGKTTIAKIFAKNVNCEKPVNGSACNECVSCQSINQGNHPDIFEIDAASNNGVDEIREIISNVYYSPISLKYKVYIIDEVHMLSKGAFNAFLKTLEEPPSHVIFIFATTEIEKIPITILSRCQRFDFIKLSEKNIFKNLEYVCQNEKIQYEKTALELISRLSDGGMRDAINLLDQVATYSEEVNLEKTLVSLQIPERNKQEIILKLIAEKDIDGALNFMTNLGDNEISCEKYTISLMYMLRDLLIYKRTNDTHFMLIENQSIIKYAHIFEQSEIIEMLLIVSNLLNDFKRHSAGNIYFEIVLLKLIEIKKTTNLKVDEIEQLKTDNPSKEDNEKIQKIDLEMMESEAVIKIQNDHEEDDLSESQIINDEVIVSKKSSNNSFNEILENATIDAKNNANQKLLNLINLKQIAARFGEELIYRDFKIVAASDQGVVVTISENNLKNIDQELLEQIKHDFEQNIYLLTTDEWLEKRQNYLNEKNNSEHDLAKTLANEFGDKVKIKG